MKDQYDVNDLLHIQKLGHKPLGFTACPISDKGMVNPHVTQFYLPDNQTISVFHVKPIYYETRAGFWRPLSEITSHHGNHRIVLNENWRNAHPRFIDWLTKRQALFGQTLLLPSPFGEVPSKYQDYVRPTVNIGMTVTTVYPDPNPETSTVDGDTFNGAGDVVYLTQWNKAGDAARPSDATVLCGQQLAGGKYYMYRGFTLFDTSAIGTDSISSAVYSIKPDSFGTGTHFTVRVVATTPATNTNLVAADFQQLGTTSGGESGSTSGMSAGTYFDITLNATGEGWINKTGVSKLGIRSAREADQTVPPSTEYLFWRTADTTGTTSDPKLVVTHAAGGATFTPRTVWFM